MAIEGVDYSSTAHANWDRLARELKAAEKHFVGRYAVGDKSPGGRGITAAEYQAMVDAGIDVFLYWQTTTNWMLGGFEAGAAGARNAQANLLGAGMPAETPVYFACDFDASPGQQAIIDECLRGAASVLGADRIGLYAGYYPLLRAKQNGSAKWFCQTSAWSGGQLMDGVHLYQYAYNQYVDGTNCDWVRAYQENYGQAIPLVIIDPPKPSIYPKDMSPQLAALRFGKLTKKRGKKETVYQFDENGPVSRAWLQMINDQLEPGESYLKATIGELTSVIDRGTDKRYVDFGFSGMPTVRFDTKTGKVV